MLLWGDNFQTRELTHTVIQDAKLVHKLYLWARESAISLMANWNQFEYILPLPSPVQQYDKNCFSISLINK